MPLKTFVKASGINNLSDARYFAVYPADWLSYNCNPNADNYVTTESIKELQGWVEGPKMALEVENLTVEQVDALVKELEPEGLQVKANFEIDTELTVFRTVDVTAETTQETLKAILEGKKTDFFVLNYTNGVSFEAISNGNLSLEDLNEINKSTPVILNNLTKAEEVEPFLNSGLTGLDIAGGNEEKAGIRSFEDIQDIMDELESWD